MKLVGRPSNFDSGPWKEISKEQGIRTVEIENADDFYRFVNLGFGYSDGHCLWRGQRRSDWEIKSSLARKAHRDSGHLQNFRDAIARCTRTEFDIWDSNSNAEEEKIKLWALGQHFGLATPLIDWTVFPYVALFFAFVERDGIEQTQHRAVYALNWREVMSINFQIVSPPFQKFQEQLLAPPYTPEFKKHLLDIYGGNFSGNTNLIEESRIPPQGRENLIRWERTRLESQTLHLHKSYSNENYRTSPQGSIHLIPPENASIEDWVRKNRRQDWPACVLTKILIGNHARKEILTTLNKMNIIYLSLFPDFEGAAKYCNMALEEHEGLIPGFRAY